MKSLNRHYPSHAIVTTFLLVATGSIGGLMPVSQARSQGGTTLVECLAGTDITTYNPPLSATARNIAFSENGQLGACVALDGNPYGIDVGVSSNSGTSTIANAYALASESSETDVLPYLETIQWNDAAHDTSVIQITSSTVTFVPTLLNGVLGILEETQRSGTILSGPYKDVAVQVAEINRVASQTTYNGQQFINSSSGTVSFSIGTNTGPVIPLTP